MVWSVRSNMQGDQGHVALITFTKALHVAAIKCKQIKCKSIEADFLDYAPPEVLVRHDGALRTWRVEEFGPNLSTELSEWFRSLHPPPPPPTPADLEAARRMLERRYRPVQPG